MTWHEIKMPFNYIFEIHIFEYKNEHVVNYLCIEIISSMVNW